jgi:hypothetical protein
VVAEYTHGFVQSICLAADPFNAESVFASGSWFALQIGSALFGVTAAHVVREIECAKVQHARPGGLGLPVEVGGAATDHRHQRSAGYRHLQRHGGRSKA